MSTSCAIVAAAIVIGKTHSGYAFSFKSEYEEYPLKISSINWTAGSRRLASLKTPTCVLFNKEKVFHSFGYEAEDKYSELAEEEEHQEWYFFKNFITTLFNEKKQLSVMINTADGKEMVAIDVFSAAIKFFRGHLQDKLKKRWTGVRETDIQWVLTVPAIWDDAAKQFMREAAEKAGIFGDQLLIVSEPETSFLYCMHEKALLDSRNYSSIGAGTKCMVVIVEEVGVEIAVYDVQHKGILKKLFLAYNCDWGEDKVKASFCSLLTDIVGEDVMEAFLSEYEYDFNEMLSDLEVKMWAICPELTDKISVSIPISLLETYLDMNPGCNIDTMISSLPKYKNKLIWIGDKLRVDAQIAKALFDESCSKIIYHMQELFLYPNLKDVSSILLVGRYAMSPMLQFVVRKAFKYPHREVFVSQNAETTDLLGAVMYGHQHKIYS